jgi:hypothetical protein
MSKSLLAGGVLAVALLFSQAAAAARVGDTVMGAVAGGLVAGPVGAIAGGAVGYTQGPRIAHHIFHRPHRYYDRRLHRWR